MTTDRQLDNQIRITDKRLAHWQKLADGFRAAQESGAPIDAAMTKQAKWLEKEAAALKKRLDTERGRRKEHAARTKRSRDNTRRTLTKLLYEIDEDLAAGRMEPWEHESAKQRIEVSLAELDRPLNPGETMRVVGIPRKKLDTAALAQLFFQQALRQVRERKGHPPLTPEEEQREHVVGIQVQAEVKRHRREEELRQQEVERRKREQAIKRLRQAKPAELRRKTWEWLVDQGLEERPADKRFGPLIHAFGGLSQPDLLQSSVIQLEDGTDYVIDQAAADELAQTADVITLVRLKDRQRIKLAYARVLWGFTDGPVFDQLDL